MDEATRALQTETGFRVERRPVTGPERGDDHYVVFVDEDGKDRATQPTTKTMYQLWDHARTTAIRLAATTAKLAEYDVERAAAKTREASQSDETKPEPETTDSKIGDA